MMHKAKAVSDTHNKANIKARNLSLKDKDFRNLHSTCKV